MATKTVFLPGYGIVVDPEDGNEVFLPGYGVVVNRPAAAVARKAGRLLLLGVGHGAQR